MIEIIRLIIVTIIICIYKNKQISKLEEKITIKETKNKSLRRVLFENNLIPEKFVK